MNKILVFVVMVLLFTVTLQHKGCDAPQTKADTDANAIEEETKIFAVGYNFGPVALAAQYQKVDNASSVEANDGDIVRVRLSTAF